MIESFFLNLSRQDIAALLEIAAEEEPEETPHSWCSDWTARAEEFLRGRGYELRPYIYDGQYNIRAGHGPHLWVELADGTILDGTVRQYCRDDMWILPEGHPLRALYIYAGAEGEPCGSALRPGGHPLIANPGTL